VSQCFAVCCSFSALDSAFRLIMYSRVCCSVLQCVAACCSVLQCVAVRCSVLQCCTACTRECRAATSTWHCSVLQYVAVCYSVLQCVAVWCSVLQCVAVSNSV